MEYRLPDALPFVFMQSMSKTSSPPTVKVGTLVCSLWITNEPCSGTGIPSVPLQCAGPPG